MGRAYDFNLLMYFLALCIGTRCLPGYHGSYNTSQTVYARSNLSPPPCLPSLRPFVSPQSPLLALCLLFCLLALACSCCLAWFPLLLHHAPPLKALEFYCSEKNAQACVYQRLVKGWELCGRNQKHKKIT